MPKIVIIDDNATLLNMTSLYLESLGWTVSCTASGADGLKLVEKEMPEAVLLDVNLGDIDGRDICRQLRADPRLKAIPVLLCSGDRKSAEDILAGVGASGADGYMLKPVGLAELGARLDALLRPRGKAPESL